ncbi:hypothetical protein MSG28_008311 [Choristoneura fumiferana]|uniref:Uncharacterized protein n=1 Tax=Choristoneura fumiferana TaxID=7141 RepID=A0ACC0JAX7_CHOFU|nr:hypothetical protein MSG28_008311 [Choristoneura fumiferana]
MSTFEEAYDTTGVVTPAIFWGYMGDEYGRRKVMLPTILATVVVSICSSMAVNFWNIKRLLGKCVSSNTSIPSRISASCATVYVYLGFGWAILPHKWSLPITGDLNLVPWRVFMWAWCLWGVLAAIGLYILPESPRYLLATRGPEAVVPVLAKMYAWNHNLHVDDYPTTLTSMCSLMNSKYSGGEHECAASQPTPCWRRALALCTLFMIGRLGAAMGAHLVGMGLQANCTMSVSFNSDGVRVSWRAPHRVTPRLGPRIWISIYCVLFIHHARTNAFYVWMPHIVNELLSSNVTTSMCNIMDMKYANKPEKPETHKCEDPVIDSRMYPISMFMGILTAIIYVDAVTN